MAKKYEIRTWEVGRREDKPVITHFIGDVDKEYLVDFFGLDKDDVERYEIEEGNNTEDYTDYTNSNFLAF